MMKHLTVAAALAGLLAGCSPTSRAVLDTAVDRVKASEDVKARLALEAPCAITVGAKNRVLSAAEKRHVEALCGGTAPQPLTLEDLRRLLTRPD